MTQSRSRRSCVSASLVLAAGLGLGVGAPAFADDPPACFVARDLGVVAAPDGMTSDQLGMGMAVSGDTLVAGAWLDDDVRGLNTGSVYVWRRAGDAWTLEQMLISPLGGADERFGEVVAIEGDTLAVGARLTDDGGTNAGAVYIFTRSNGVWTFQTRLVADDRAGGDNFGTCVALHADTLVVGAPRKDIAGQEDRGAAYVFTREGGVWTQHPGLTAVGRPSDHFGDAVAVGDAGEVFIGAPQHDIRPPGSQHTLLDTGAVFVFSADAGGVWTQRQKLSAAVLTTGARFGSALAVDAALLAIGAEGEATGGVKAGSAYVFTSTAEGWIQQQKLTPPEPRADDDFFGASIAAADGVIVVSARSTNVPGFEDAGSGFLYAADAGVWSLRSTFAAPAPTEDLYFGATATIGGGAAFFSAPYHDVNDQADAGGVFAFQYLGVAPSVTAQPEGVRTCGVSDVSFSAGIGGDAPLAIQWRRDGVALTDGPTKGGSVISGAGTGTLTIAGAGRADHGLYDLVASNACGDVVTDAAELLVCTADWACDGVANSTDVSAFINDWFVDQAKGTLLTDIDANGVVNSADVSEFINIWFEDVESGC